MAPRIPGQENRINNGIINEIHRLGDGFFAVFQLPAVFLPVLDHASPQGHPVGCPGNPFLTEPGAFLCLLCHMASVFVQFMKQYSKIGGERLVYVLYHNECVTIRQVPKRPRGFATCGRFGPYYAESLSNRTEKPLDLPPQYS